jgi:hypothetical protein
MGSGLESTMHQRTRRLTLYEPATYLIRVQGMLDSAWSDRLGGMSIESMAAGRETATELIGRLPDQAALIGLLTSLYDLGLPLLSVERTADNL